MRVRLGLAVRLHEDDLGEHLAGAANSCQPAAYNPHMVANLDWPKVEPEPDPLGRGQARHSVPVVGSALQAQRDQPGG